MHEYWSSVIGYEGVYWISDQGRMRNRHGHILSSDKTCNGYLRFNLQHEGTKQRKQVHCIVAEAFIGPKPKGHQVNHKNRVRHDNRLENLEYLSAGENIKHGFDALGGNPKTKGSKHWHAKLDEDDVLQIRSLRAEHSINYLASKYSVSIGTISMICNRRIWTHV